MPPDGLQRTDYFGAGFTLLSQRGHDGLTIAALCRQLGVTKGSFYHHFRDFSDFVTALLDFWASEHATQLIALSAAVADAHERIDVLKGIAINLPHGAEAAIRAWSWSNATVALVQQQVDQARLDHLTQAGADIGLSPERARLMATMSMSLLVGLQQLDRPADPELVDEVFSEMKCWMLASTLQR